MLCLAILDIVGTRDLLLRPDLRDDVTQASVETGKESATPRRKSFAYVGIVEILRIAVEETTLRRPVKIQVREHGGEDDGIRTCRIPFATVRLT